MKPHPRIRKRVQRRSSTTSALLLAAWIAAGLGLIVAGGYCAHRAEDSASWWNRRGGHVLFLLPHSHALDGYDFFEEPAKCVCPELFQQHRNLRHVSWECTGSTSRVIGVPWRQQRNVECKAFPEQFDVTVTVTPWVGVPADTISIPESVKCLRERWPVEAVALATRIAPGMITITTADIIPAAIWALACYSIGGAIVIVAGTFSLRLLITWARSSGRAGRGECVSCGYDRTGLPPHAPCPECASPP